LPLNSGERETTLTIEILKLLTKERRLNTRQISIALGKEYQTVRSRLFSLKLRRLVDSEHVKRYVPGLAWILMNEWWITPEGERWLKSVIG